MKNDNAQSLRMHYTLKAIKCGHLFKPPKLELFRRDYCRLDVDSPGKAKLDFQFIPPPIFSVCLFHLKKEKKKAFRSPPHRQTVRVPLAIKDKRQSHCLRSICNAQRSVSGTGSFHGDNNSNGSWLLDAGRLASAYHPVGTVHTCFICHRFVQVVRSRTHRITIVTSQSGLTTF